MRKDGSCCNSSACRSGRTKGTRLSAYGYDSEDREGTEDTQVQDPAAQPLPPVRPSARLHAEVRAVPSVLPQAGAGRRRHRGDEKQLVNCQVTTLKVERV